MRLLYLTSFAAWLAVAGQMPSVLAHTSGECEVLMASDHTEVFEKLRTEVEAQEDEYGLASWAIPSSEEVKAVRELALACYRVRGESDRDLLWSISWAYRVIENGLVGYRELARPPGGLREYKNVILESIDYATHHLTELDRGPDAGKSFSLR